MYVCSMCCPTFPDTASHVETFLYTQYDNYLSDQDPITKGRDGVWFEVWADETDVHKAATRKWISKRNLNIREPSVPYRKEGGIPLFRAQSLSSVPICFPTALTNVQKDATFFRQQCAV